LIY
ncbi:hypothetical protein BVZ46_01035B, partial [Haemophilus influenzae]|jgi:Derlin-2/3